MSGAPGLRWTGGLTGDFTASARFLRQPHVLSPAVMRSRLAQVCWKRRDHEDDDDGDEEESGPRFAS